MKATLLALSLFVAAITPYAAETSGPKVRALLITGGCCHDYTFQTESMQKAFAAHAQIEWIVVNEGGRGTRAQIDFYENPDWAKPFDVVIHNECFADTADESYIRSITKAHHDGTPAVVIHCAMHTYRAAEIDDWREFLGVTSRRHDHQSNYLVKNTATDHPIMKGFPESWTSPMDELYVIDKLWPNAKALATSVSERDGKVHPVFWTNTYGKGRVFGSTFGHSNDTFKNQVFLDTLARGLLWAANK